MAIGFRELLILLPLFVLLIAAAIWLIIRLSRGSSSRGGQRSAAGRLAELDSLRKDGQISPDEYEKQRVTIISHI